MTTWRKVGCCLAVAAGVSFSASAKTCTWINTTTATAQDWREPTNWQDGQVPAAGDDVVFDAAANVNLAGADIGTITHTAGALTIDTAGSVPWTNRGDIVTTGASVNFPFTARLYLPGGEHMLSNTCSVTYMRDPSKKSSSGFTVTGAGALTKMGKGGFLPNSSNTGDTWAPLYYSATGRVKILEGYIRSSGQNGHFRGPTEIVIDGYYSYFNIGCTSGNNSLNSDVTIWLLNEARILAYESGHSHAVKALYVGEKQCAAGTWGSWSLNTDYKWVDVGSRGKSLTLNVAEGPAEGGFTGLGDSLWSGRTRHWIWAGGQTSSSDWENSAKWQDGKAARELDDIVIDTQVTFRYIPVEGFIWHDLTLSEDVQFGHYLPCTTGDIHLNGNTLTFNWQNKGLTLWKGSHVIDGGGSVLFDNASNEKGLQGSGDLVLRDSVTLTYKGSSYDMPLSGGITVESGSFVWDSSKSLSACTNITVTGAGSTFWMKRGSINTNICVAVEKGGKVKLANAVSNDIAHLHLDGRDRSPRTYGSSASSADRKLDAYFDKTTAGMFRVTDGPIPGLLLLVR